MSIPKEPRQLMINIMYLVLTALLALNVSAEVMNAFFTLDKGNKNSMNVVDEQLDATISSLDELLKDDSKAKYRPIQPAIKEVRSITAEFNQHVDDLRDVLIDAAGDNNGSVDAGDFKEGYDGQLSYIKGKKNKDVTTRLLVDGQGLDRPLGEVLKEKIVDTRERLIAAYRSLIENEENAKAFGLNASQVETFVQSVAQEMPFNIESDEEWQAVSDKDSWRQYKFYHMPVAAVLPLLSQMQSDLKVSEANMINNMATLAGGKVIEFDAFVPVVSADRSYVIGGESIKAKVSVGTYSTALDPANISITANGRALSINEDGTADLNIPASGTGQKKVSLKVAVTNPLTGEVTEGDGEFVYEVGTRSVAVSADKMNVFYIGVDNPITISASGVSSNDVRVTASGINITGSGSTRNVTATKPGDAKITVSANGSTLGSFDFRVKRIPDPVAKIGRSKGGTMGNGEFKAQDGVLAILEGFDFDARCNIAGFKLVRVPPRDDAIVSDNRGATFNAGSRRLVNAAKPGDTFYFQNVRAKCPGDNVTREINSMIFNIR